MMITKTVAALIGGASLLTAMLGGCVMKSEATAESKAAHMYCTDTRDGEKFAFKGATVRNASVGFGGADSCFDVTTDDGKPRLLCKSHEAFIKCENKTPNALAQADAACGVSPGAEGSAANYGGQND